MCFQGRGNRGGGVVGATCPTTLKLWGRCPPTLDSESRLFLFLLVFARELGSIPKNNEPNPGSFLVLGRGYLGPQETFAPPPPNFKVVSAPLYASPFGGAFAPLVRFPVLALDLGNINEDSRYRFPYRYTRRSRMAYTYTYSQWSGNGRGRRGQAATPTFAKFNN